MKALELSTYPPSLTRTWLAYELACGVTRAEAMRRMNGAIGTRCTQSLLRKWLCGAQDPCRPTRLWMMRRCVEQMMRHGGCLVSAEELV